MPRVCTAITYNRRWYFDLENHTYWSTDRTRPRVSSSERAAAFTALDPVVRDGELRIRIVEAVPTTRGNSTFSFQTGIIISTNLPAQLFTVK